jgi:hypothetical protein
MIRVVIFGLCVGLSSVVVRAEPGLVARYDDGKQTVETVAPVVAFGLGENDSVHPQVGTKFTAEYEGSLKVVRRGTYTFDAQGATLTIDGKPVAGPVELEGGEHTIDLKYRRKGGPARLELLWSSPEFLPEPVPASVLSHKDSDAAHKQALVEEGRTLVEELNCAGCHGGQGARRLKSFVGPDLSNVGGRANELWVDLWLRDPS